MLWVYTLGGYMEAPRLVGLAAALCGAGLGL